MRTLEQVAKRILSQFNNDKEKAKDFIRGYSFTLTGYLGIKKFEKESENYIEIEWSTEQTYTYDESLFYELDKDDVDDLIADIEKFMNNDGCHSMISFCIPNLPADLIAKIPSKRLSDFYCDFVLNTYDVYRDLLDPNCPEMCIHDLSKEDSDKYYMQAESSDIEKYDLVNIYNYLASEISDFISENLFFKLEDLIEKL